MKGERERERERRSHDESFYASLLRAAGESLERINCEINQQSFTKVDSDILNALSLNDFQGSWMKTCRSCWSDGLKILKKNHAFPAVSMRDVGNRNSF